MPNAWRGLSAASAYLVCGVGKPEPAAVDLRDESVRVGGLRGPIGVIVITRIDESVRVGGLRPCVKIV